MGGRLATVEVEHVLETPSRRPPEAGTPLVRLEEDHSNVDRTAKGVRGGGEAPLFEPGDLRRHGDRNRYNSPVLVFARRRLCDDRSCGGIADCFRMFAFPNPFAHDFIRCV
jgi:hypothetical protein